MISRYSNKEFDDLWSEQNKYRTWLNVELAACQAMTEAGLVPEGVLLNLLKLRINLIPERISEIELTTRHDVIAFLTHVEEVAGPDARWLHLGITSSDILDTSFSLLLLEATHHLKNRLSHLIHALEKKAVEFSTTPMMGRSHGMHAEPITVGMFFAGHLVEMKRSFTRLTAAQNEISYGKLSGAVGSYANLSPEIEKRALELLCLEPETVSTQVIPRDRYASFFSTLALIASGIERLATNIRHLQRTEVHEVEEKFSSGQKGSSAMPHKKNPITSENLCGLARIVRSSVIPALENVPLWHERDISHSSVERMIAPDATGILYYMLDKCGQLINNLVIYPESMLKNVESSNGIFYSEAVMLALVKKGLPRQKAYELVQKNAMEALKNNSSFQDLLNSDALVISYLSSKEIYEIFDLNHALRHAQTIVDRALRLDY